MSEDLLIIGAGGHARVIASLLQYTDWRVKGVLDRSPGTLGESIGRYTVTGLLDDLSSYFTRGVRHVALAIGDNNARAEWFERISSLGFEAISLRHPTALIESSVLMGTGIVVCLGAIVGADTRIGNNAIINSGAIVDHECEIGDHAHIAPGVRLAGRVHVGDRTFVGIGSSVRQQVVIGASTVIGAGSVVVKNIPPNVTAFGCPARVHRGARPS